MTWERVTPSKPCVICGKGDYCTRGDFMARCMRISEGSHRECLERGGWFHWTDKPRPVDRDPPPPELPDRCAESVERMQRHWNWLNRNSTGAIERHAVTLGVRAETLLGPMQVGFESASEALAFPMMRAGVGIIGIRYRAIEGRKWCNTGGRNGLFLPELSNIGQRPGCMIVEGPTDTAALVELGFNAFGKPQAQGHRRLIAECVHHYGWESVVIWRDDDPPQKNGEPGDGPRHSAKLAMYLAACMFAGELPKLRRITVAQPPEGFKDCRAWKNAGATRDEIIRHVLATREEHTPKEIMDGRRITHRCADLYRYTPGSPEHDPRYDPVGTKVDVTA